MAKVTRDNFVTTITDINSHVIGVRDNQRGAVIALGDVVNYVTSLEHALDMSDGWIYVPNDERS